MDTIKVALAADENYAIPLSAAMLSAAENATDASLLEFAVLSCGISDASRQRLARILPPQTRVTFIDVPNLDRLEHLPTESRWITHPTAATYARFCLGTLLPTSWQRVIYLDSDLLVFGPLDELWEIPLGNHPLGAVCDPIMPNLSSDLGVQAWEREGLNPLANYFNAGVLLIDLDRWRETGIEEKAFKYVTRNAENIILFDQEALNAVLNGNFLCLPPRWNFVSHDQNVPYRCGQIPEEVRIRHFTGRYKPWMGGTCEEKSRDLYIDYITRIDSTKLDEFSWA